MADWNESNVLMAFTVDQASSLSGISRAQLASWDRSGFFRPSFADDNRRLSYSRIYTFRDVASLRVLHELRNESRVPLDELRAVKHKLVHLGEDLWSKTTLYVLNRKVIFDNPETRLREEVVSGQGIVNIPLEVVTDRLHAQAAELRKRDSSSVGQVEKKRGVAQNQPVIAGTRITVDTVRSFHDAGYTVAQIIAEFPSLTEEDVKSALAYDDAA